MLQARLARERNCLQPAPSLPIAAVSQMTTAANRLHGPSGRARLDEVAAWIDGCTAALGAEEVPLAQAAGRALARDVAAAADLPPCDRAAADGFALNADETVGASPYNPL